MFLQDSTTGIQPTALRALLFFPSRINNGGGQLFLTAHLREAHLKAFKSKAVTVSTAHYGHSSVAFSLHAA